MSPGALKRLSAVLAALLGTWGAWTAVETRSSRPRPLWPEAPAAAAFTVAGPGGRVVLERLESAWSLSAPFRCPADGPYVEAALKSLSEARLSAPLSDDPARLGLFELDDAQAVRIELGGRALLVGSSAADPSAAFVREPGSPLVREASGLSRWRQAARPGVWADKTLAAVDGSRVTRLKILSPKGTVDLRPGGGGWERAKPALDSLARLAADEVLDAGTLEAEPRARLERVELRVEVETLDYKGEPGTPAVSITVSPVGQDFRHLARVKGREGVVYSLAGWRLEPFRL